MSKPWPTDGSPVGFTSIIEPLRDAIKQLYTLERRPFKDVDYKGLEMGQHAKAICFSPCDALTVENLQYAEEDQGRDPMTEVLSIAIQLGIEQGRRIERSKI